MESFAQARLLVYGSRCLFRPVVLAVCLVAGALAMPTRAADWRSFESGMPAHRPAHFESGPATAEDGASVIMRVSAKADACADATADCRDALKSLRDDDIAGVSLDIRVGGKPGNDYPCECRIEGETYEPRRFATTMFTWKAAGYCHKPLYFEDWNLERYGHSHGWADPIISGVHFFATLPVLPYKMGVELPWECVYPLGYYRPGNCAPWTCPAVPISGRGLALEAATVTGLVFLLP